MSTQENKKLVMEGYQLFKKGDIRGLLDRYHDNAEWIAPEAEYLPFGGSFHGKQEIGRFFAELDASVQATRFEPRHFIAEGDKVVVTGDSSWMAKATGIAYDNPWVHVFTIHDGKVARFEGYYDTAPASRALHPVTTAAATAATHLHH